MKLGDTGDLQHISHSFCCRRRINRYGDKNSVHYKWMVSEWDFAVSHQGKEVFNLGAASVLNYPSFNTGSYPLEQLIDC